MRPLEEEEKEEAAIRYETFTQAGNTELKHASAGYMKRDA